MDRLAGTPELLDGPLDDEAAVRGNLRDLTRINRWLGGVALSRRALEPLIDGRSTEPRLLDVGTGAADIPIALLDDAQRRRRPLRVTAIDSRLEVLAAARAIRPDLDTVPDLDLLAGDGRELPFEDDAFDIVHASLLVHHLEPSEAVAFLREASRVARRGVVVNDLVRGRAQWLMARALVGLTTRNRFTRHDGPLSVRRAYTRDELRSLLGSARLQPIIEVVGVLGHRVAIAAVPARDAGR